MIQRCFRNRFNNIRIRGAQIKMCILSICLLWLSSYYMAQLIVFQLVQVPETNFMINRVANFIVRLEESRTSYADCMSMARDYCLMETSLELYRERTRIYQLHDRNDQVIKSTGVLATECSNDEQFVFNYIAYLQSNNLIDLQKLKKQVPGNACANIEALIKSEATGRAVVDLSSSYADNTQLHSQNMQATLEKQQEYDKQLLETQQKDLTESNIAGRQDTISTLNGVQKNLNQFRTCATTGDCGNLEQVSQVRDKISNGYETIYNDYYSSYDSVQKRLESFEKLYKDFQDSAGLQLLDLVVDFPTFDIPSIMGDFGSPNFIGPLNFDDQLDQLETKIESAVVNQTQEQLDKANQKLDDAKVSQQEAIENLTIDATATSPYISAFEENRQSMKNDSEALQNETELFLNSIANTVDGLGSFNTSTAPDIDVNLNDTSPMNYITPQSTLEFRTSGDWYVYLYDNIVFANIMDTWAFVQSLTYMFDWVLRIVMTLQIIFKYSRSFHTIGPSIDIRTDHTCKKDGAGITPMQRAAMIMTHPGLAATIGTAFMVVLLFIMFTIYMPVFENFVDGCRQSDFTGNGTFITQNAKSWATQYVDYEGNRISIDTAQTIEANVSQECTFQTNNASFIYNDMQAQYTNAKQLLSKSRTNLETLDLCIDLVQIEPFLKSKATTGVCFAPDALQDLTVPSFQCVNISTTCTMTCRQPSSVLLAYWSWDTGCAVEGCMHGNMLGFLFSVWLFIVFNISRVIVLKALELVNLNSFICAKVTCMATLDVSTQKLHDVSQDTIEKAFQGELRRLKRKGFLQLALVFCLVGASFLGLYIVGAQFE